MSQKPSYTYIQWLPQSRIIAAVGATMLADKYISGLFDKDVYIYNRDDNAIMTLPAASVYHGELFSYDNYDRIEGEIIINVYSPLSINRDSETESLETTLGTLQLRIQNNAFATQVVLNMFEYNKTLASMRTQFDKECFQRALKTSCPLQRFAINMEIKYGNAINIAEIGDCFKSTIKFKYWMAQQAYYKLLEIIGVNGEVDPNKIVYPLWETFDINIEEV